MARITGITVERDYNGTPKTITFNYKRYGDLLLNFFEKEGINYISSPYNKKEVEKLLSIKADMKHGIRKEVNMSNFWGD